MSARERLALLIERLERGEPLVQQGDPWVWPEGDPVRVDGDRYPRWLP